MASEAAKITALTNAAEIPILANSVVKNLSSLARRAHSKGWIVAYSGRTGIGKSVAVDYLDTMLPFAHRLIRCKQTTTLSGMVRAIAYLPGEKIPTSHRYQKNTHQLYELSVERAQSDPYLLIIDEADRLRGNCFECLRDLWDDARLPMLLIGNEDLEAIINSRHERLARRLRVRFTQKELSKNALREVLEFMGFSFTDEEFAKLHEVCGGSPGWAEAVLLTRNEIAESYGERPNKDHLMGALRYFPTLRGKQKGI